jgi:FkbM family methyltransferase
MNRLLAHILLQLMAAPLVLEPRPGWCLGSREAGSGALLRLRKRLWESTRTAISIKWLNGTQIYIYAGNEICRSIFLTGCYEPNEFCLLERILRPGMTFIDVGANIGLYTVFAGTRVGREGVIVAVEPSSREFGRLKENTNLNKLTNVRLLQIAVSNFSAEAQLLVATEEKSGHNTLGAFGYDSVVLANTELVHVEPLDNIINEEGLQRVDVIKMDIEGAELFALQGAICTLKRFHPIIMLELSDRTLQNQKCSSTDVWQFLTQHGYRIYTYSNTNGVPVPAVYKHHFDAEDIVALHESTEGRLLRN